MKSRQPIIHLSNIYKDYRSGEVITKVLKGISLKIHKGEFTAIIGPSGSGKTTLMNIIGLLDVPTKGEYIFQGVKITDFSEDKLAFLRNRKIGFVFQSFNLLSRVSALENVMLPAVYAGVKEVERKKHAIDLLSKIGLDDKLLNKPNQLSGGQQQKVAIARALMNDPEIILADEPTGNLDTKSGADVMKILKKLNDEGKTILVITHEKDIARKAKRIVRVKDGKII